jgi:hypothetical protein
MSRGGYLFTVVFFLGGEGIGTDAVSGYHFAKDVMFKFRKDVLTDMDWVGHDFNSYCVDIV